MAPRGIRNNNPGNIEFGPFAKGAGAVGSDGRFAIFPNMNAGQHAMVKLLRSYAGRGFDTPRKMINRWAPPSDGNDSNGYAAFAAQRAGISPDQPLDFNNQAQVEQFVQGMILRENGVLPTGDSPIGTATQGGVVASQDTAAGGEGMDRLKSLLGKGYDPDAISAADQLIESGDETAKGAKNWLDVLNTGLSAGFGTYMKSKEGAKKKEFQAAFREGLTQAQDAKGIAKLLMASPDEATQLKGAALFADAQAAELKAKKDGQASYGKQPMIGRDKKTGELVAIQYNDRGEAVRTPLPADVELSDKIMQIDTADGTSLYGANSQRSLGRIDKNLANAEAEKKRGELQEIGRHNLPSVESRTDRLLTRLDKLANSEMRKSFTGLSGWLPNVTPEARDYQGLQDEIAGNTFLAGFSDLKGGGAITEVEGLKAEQAISRLKTIAPSDAGYLEAVQDAKAVFEEIRRNARLRAGLAAGDASAGAGAGVSSPPDAGAGNFKVLKVR